MVFVALRVSAAAIRGGGGDRMGAGGEIADADRAAAPELAIDVRRPDERRAQVAVLRSVAVPASGIVLSTV